LLSLCQVLELLAWFGSTDGDHFSNIYTNCDDNVESADDCDEMVDVNDLLFMLSGFGATDCPVGGGVDPCAGDPCTYAEACIVTANRNFICRCPDGTSGETCEINADDCLDHACINGVCVDDVGTYSCRCTPGYGGAFCDAMIEPPMPVFAELSFDMDMAQIEESFDARFSRDIGRALQIPAAAVTVLSKTPGSVIVIFVISPNANFNATGNGGFAYEPADKLAELASMVRDETSRLFTGPGTGRWNSLINTDRLKPAHNRAVLPLPPSTTESMMCDYYGRSIGICENKLSAAAFCSDMSCKVALDAVQDPAVQLSCAGDGFPVDAPAWDTICSPEVQVADTLACATDVSAAAALDSYFTAGFALTDAAATADDGGVTLNGDAYVISGTGVHLDGHGDSVLLDLGNSYGTDGSFTVSLWFTKSVCHIEGQWELLYMHTSDMDAGPRFFGDPSISGIGMGIGCNGAGGHSTASGDLVRIHVRDDSGLEATFDWQVGCAGSGDYLSDTWIHLAVSVSPDSIRLYADGTEQTIFGYGRDLRRGYNMATLANPAYPNPAKLSSSLGGITFQGLAMVGNFMLDQPGWTSWTAVADIPDYDADTTSFVCSSDTMGDPGGYSWEQKSCLCQGQATTCALEGETCVCAGYARYGADTRAPPSGPEAGFVGRIAYVQVFPDLFSEGDATCLFSHEIIEACDDAAIGALATDSWSLTGGEWDPASRTFTADPLCSADDAGCVTLVGNSEYHHRFGVSFDGDADYASIMPSDDYTADGTWTISFWASQTLCTRDGSWENLYLHYQQAAEGEEAVEYWDSSVASVALRMICWNDTPQIVAQVTTGTVDDTTPGFNAGMSVVATDDVVRTGGYATANWVSFGFSLDATSMGFFVDGFAVPMTEDTFGSWGWQGTPGDPTDTQNSNAANPVPSSFAFVLPGFSLDGAPILLGGDTDAGTFGSFEGNIAALSIYGSALDMHQFDCLYQTMEATVPICTESAGQGFQSDFTQLSRSRGGYEMPDNAFLSGDTFINGQFGLTFDGDGDYMTIRGNAMDFADDGTFAIALWFTKPVCNVPGKWEFVFSQLEHADRPITWSRNSGIDLFIGCGGRLQTSTIEGDILRAVFVDSDRNLAMFDMRINGEEGGALTDTWTHLVMNVHPAQRAWSSGEGRRVLQDAAPIAAAGGGAATVGTGQRGVGAFGAGAGGGASCGITPPTDRAARFGPERSGVDNGGVQVFINGAELSAADFGFPLLGDDPERATFLAGGGSNEEFDNMQVESAIRRARVNSARTDSGWTDWRSSDDASGGFDAATNTWQCNNRIFTDPNPGTRKFCECEGSGVCAEEGGECICSTRVRYGATRITIPDVASDGSAGGRDRTSLARGPMNVAFPDPSNFSRPLGRFDSANQYRDDDDQRERLNGIPVGDHTFNAIAGSSTGTASGWHGGWFEILDSDGERVAGGEVDGLVEGRGTTVSFTVSENGVPTECRCESECTNQAEGRGGDRRSRTYTLDDYMCQVQDQRLCDMQLDEEGRRVCEVDGYRLNIFTGWRAQDIYWTIDDGEQFQMDKAPIFIGGRGGLEDDNFFVGSVGSVSVSTDVFSHKDINCMYLHGSQSMGHCDAPRNLAFSSSLLESIDSTPPKTVVGTDENDVTLYGNTYLDQDFGAVMDGTNDFLTFEDRGYTSGTAFTLGFWFTSEQACRNPGRWQFLYSEASDPEAAFYAVPEAAVEVYLGCAESQRDDLGDVLRTYVQDACGTTALFDIPVRQIRDGGPVTSQWVHYLLSVSSDSLQSYVDGERVSDWDVEFKEDGFARNWIQSPANSAWPRPSRLRDSLCGSGITEIYGSRGDNDVDLNTLVPGTEYTIRWEAGAFGQFWIGSAAGRAQCNDATSCTFAEAVPAACTGADEAGNQCVLSVYGWGCADMPAAADGTPAADDICFFTEAQEATCGEAPCAVNVDDLVATTTLDGQAGSATFTATDGTWLSIQNGANRWDTSAQIASEMRWAIDIPDTDEDLAGPATGTSFVGGRSDRADDHYFWGSMAGLTVQTSDIGDVEARCMYQAGEKQIGVCDSDQGHVKIDVFSGPNLDSLPRWGTSMGGSAHVEDDYGVTLDGREDYVRIDRPENDYANSGRFALSFWFTKAVCHVPGDYEILYSHHADNERWSGCRHGADGRCSTCNPGIQVYLGCFSDGTDGYTATSTISGDVIRTMITDDDCRTAVWDSPLNNAAAGYITDQWVHFALSVWGSGAHTYVDGESIDADEVGFPIASGRAARWWGWATGPGNIAYNDLDYRGLRNFTEPIGTMTLFENPQANTDLTRQVQLGAGTHTFTPLCGERPEFCQYSQGWGEGTFFTITDFAQRVMSGGPHGFFSEPDVDGVEAIVPEYVANSGTRTEDEAVALCAQQCGDDYRYVGLQWSHECYCDNDFAERGGGLDNNACDADADGSPDCGQGVDGVCPMMNAVYDTTPSAACRGTNDGTIAAVCVGSEDGAGAECMLNADESGCTVATGNCTYVESTGAACALDMDESGCAVDGGDCTYAPAPAFVYMGCFSDGPATVAGGPIEGIVSSLTQEEYCTTGSILSDELRCDASPCCYFSNSIGECRPESRDDGSRTCMMNPSSGAQFTLPQDTSVTVTVSISYRAQSPWAVNWVVDDGADGKYGPLKGHVFLGAANEGTAGWNSNNGYMGSIAAVKTFSRPLRPSAAKCQFQEQERHVGICEDIGSVLFEAEFTSRTSGTDQERDLNGKVTLDVGGIEACFELCKSEYSYFGLQWGSMCSCGNEVGQHGLAPVATVAEACDTAGYIDPSLEAECAAVVLGTDTSAVECRAVRSRYVGVSQRLTWAEARTYCQANYDGDLASIHSDIAQANAVTACADATDDLTCWIGYNDIEEEGNFVWSDGSPSDFDHFSPGQPDEWHPEDGGEDFVQLWHRTDDLAQFGSWNDMADTALAFVCETQVSSVESEAQNCAYTAATQVDECSFECRDNAEESCSATDEDVCRGRDIIADLADETDETCLDAMGAGCTYTAGTLDSPSTDCPEGCTLTPSVAAITAETNQAMCEAAGACTYYPADDSVVYRDAGCYSAAVDTCSSVDLASPFARYSCSGDRGCVYTAFNATDRTMESCTAVVSRTFCEALDSDNCNDTPGCEYREAVTQRQRCRAAARDNCRAVVLPSDQDTCEAVSGCSYTAATPSDQRLCGGADRNSVYIIDVPTTSSDPPTASYVGCFVDGSSSRTYSLGGDASQVSAFGEGGSFGLTFDGNGDWAELTAAPDYANDGTFSISFWFTKTPCLDPDGPYQTLYAHQGTNRSQLTDPRLLIMVGCSAQGSHSTVSDGDIIRIMGTDDAQQQFAFDAAMKDAEGGGFVTTMWVHFVLTMDTEGARVFIDGRDVSNDLGHPEPNRWMRWAQTRSNIAWPNPMRFGEWTGRDLTGAHGYLRVESCTNFVGVGQAMTWDDARAYCQATYPGGDLASILDEDAQGDASAACVAATDSLQCWIGLTDAAEEGVFIWADGSPISYEHWASGEPNDWGDGPSTENYGMMSRRDDGSETWNDAAGSQTHAFVCQTATVSSGACSYDSGVAASCGAGCTYTAPGEPTLAGALAECTALCRKNDDFEFKYMGLQFSNECFVSPVS
jgi:hypothetical protein